MADGNWDDPKPKTYRTFRMRVPRGLVVAGALGLALIILVSSSLHTVGPGERAVVFHQNGSLSVMEPGKFQFVLPVLNSVTTYNVQSALFKESAEGISKDIQVVTTEVAVLYHPDVAHLADIHRELGQAYADRIVTPSVQDAVKSAVSYWNAEELTAATREQVKQDIAVRITKDLAAHHVLVDQVSITDFDFSPEFNAATEAKVVAQQRALEAKNKLEQTKYEANQTIVQAQAQAEAARLLAQSATSEQGSAYLFLEWLKKWDGHLPTTLMGDDTGTILQLPR